MLTKKQLDLLDYINKRIQRDGVPPSFDEMKEALDLRSKSGIHRLITALEERGFIRRMPHRARALEVLKLPESAVAESSRGFRPSVVEGGFPGPVARAREASDALVSMPLYGRIAAGTPIEALCDHSNAVGIPGNMIGKGEHYALEIEGDSMIDAGIHDGDTVVIRRSDTADNGSIVVALVEDTEVTLKRLRRKGASVALEPANTEYETRIFGPDQVKVQGCLVGLIRKY